MLQGTIDWIREAPSPTYPYFSLSPFHRRAGLLFTRTQGFTASKIYLWGRHKKHQTCYTLASSNLALLCTAGFGSSFRMADSPDCDETMAPAILGVVGAFMGVAICVTVLRVYTRHHLLRSLAWDDFVIVFSMVSLGSFFCEVDLD